MGLTKGWRLAIQGIVGSLEVKVNIHSLLVWLVKVGLLVIGLFVLTVASLSADGNKQLTLN